MPNETPLPASKPTEQFDCSTPSTRDQSGLDALLMMAAYHGIAADRAKLLHTYGNIQWQHTVVVHAAQSLGFSAKYVQQPRHRLDRAPLPCIALATDGSFFILATLETAQTAERGAQSQQRDRRHDATPQLIRALIQRPGSPPEVVNETTLLSMWQGALIFLTSKANFIGGLARFDFSWFIPAIIKYRRLLGEVLIISLVLQVLGVITPLFFQVIMDKVLVNNALQTLHVVALGLVCVTVFETLLSGVRTYVFAHTSSKLDVELGARLLHHLLALPIRYFQQRRVGDSVARVRELENIRTFLTGNAVTLLLDVVFSIVLMAVMFWYSVKLAVIVAASIPLYLLLSVFFTPILRARLNEKFQRSAQNQAFLVETITNITTVKAMAIEPRWQDTWEKQLAGYVVAGLSTTAIATIASQCVTLVSKLVTIAILWFGAHRVMNHQLTVGELIAFNMLASQVASPILRLAQLWNDFQQVGISMERLGDILNTPQEIEGHKSRLPRLAGAITFDQVSFRYRPDAPDVIRALSFQIKPGEVIGIVGRSGSGKSTLTHLVQRLYIPDRGRVLIDGIDSAILDTASFRHQIGVVLQESTLFHQSIRANIAISDPSAPIERIIQAAQLAGAHEFICELPEGYDTLVGEQGSGLSGGQRQRIAIARAVMRNPRILIFDEATSALDYESEKIINDNMQGICQGRTVLIIAHRLSAVRRASRIIVMERGQIAEEGTHHTLINRPDGIYSHLYRMQQN